MKAAHILLEAVYDTLSAHADPAGTVQLSQRDLAAGVSGITGERVPPDVVAGALAVLTFAGYVVRRPRLDPRNGANTYGIHPPEPQPLAPVLELVRGDVS